MEGEAGAVADSRECAVRAGGGRRQHRRVVGDACMAPQDPAQEVPLRRAGHFGGADCFAGVGRCKLSLKKLLVFFLESNIFCIFAIGK